MGTTGLLWAKGQPIGDTWKRVLLEFTCHILSLRPLSKMQVCSFSKSESIRPSALILS